MFHVSLSRTSVLFMHVGISETGKKVARSSKGAKKVEVFIQNMFFQQIVHSL